MSRYWNASVSQLTPYTPGEQPRDSQLIKLNTNELPYPPSQKALEAMRVACNEDLRLYPDPECRDLRTAIARLENCAIENVFVGNGSDEVLGHAFRALIPQDGDVLFADITYGFYPVYCRLFGLEHREIPLSEAFTVNIDDYISKPARAIVIANPNANTGIALPQDALVTLLKARPDCTVIVDEAYIDFGAQSVAPLISRFHNLLVVQTLSKSRGLAGLRVGFALGHADLVDGLTRVKDSFNSYPLSRVAQAGAKAAIEDTLWLSETTSLVKMARTDLSRRLSERGFDVLPSQANFITVKHHTIQSGALYDSLRQEKILVRHLSTKRICDWLRITIGTAEQHDALISVVDVILHSLTSQDKA